MSSWQRLADIPAQPVSYEVRGDGGLARNRTGVHGFAIRCVTTPPRGLRYADLCEVECSCNSEVVNLQLMSTQKAPLVRI
jgi:hypothetical protein